MHAKPGIVTVLLACSLGVVPAPAEGIPVRLYVSIKDGKDRNPGTEQAPFQTIQKAQATVREAIARGMTADICVEIRGGTYYLDQPLSFDNRDSGRDGHKVIYRAFGGERPRIVGGVPLTGWEPAEGKLFKVKIGKDRDVHALFENGQWCTLARSPNRGYWQAVNGSNDQKNATLEFRPGDLPAGFGYRDASVAVWAGRHFSGLNYDWFESLVPIRDIDWNTRTITRANRTYWNVSPNNRFYVMGAREFLDEPGEFSLNREEGVLYYWPRTLPIERQEIIIPTAMRAISIRGTSPEQPVGNLVFEGLLIDISDSITGWAQGLPTQGEGLVYMENARNVIIRNCHLRNGGMEAIMMLNANQGHLGRDQEMDARLPGGPDRFRRREVAAGPPNRSGVGQLAAGLRRCVLEALTALRAESRCGRVRLTTPAASHSRTRWRLSRELHHDKDEYDHEGRRDEKARADDQPLPPTRHIDKSQHVALLP